MTERKQKYTTEPREPLVRDARSAAGTCALLLLFFGLAACGGASPGPRAALTTSHGVGRDVPSVSQPEACGRAGIALQVLGSGGPIMDDDRASTGYVVWQDGRARLLVDIGGGVALRLAQVGLDADHLDAVLISHAHVDHTGDLPALLKSLSFSDRTRPLAIVGPVGAAVFPSSEELVSRMIGAEGVWRYLGGYERGQPFRLTTESVATSGSSSRVFEADGLIIDAVGVPHGPVPALGFLVTLAGTKIAFGGDQRLDDSRFLALAQGVDLLVAHHAIPEGMGGVAAGLHASPSQIGAFARDSHAQALVLSHHMARSLGSLSESLRIIGDEYEGPTHVASDLDCYALAAFDPRP